jgi:hypothetical protein
MPSFENAYSTAHKGLLPIAAASKHVIVISDADPSGPNIATVDAMIKDRITISTVAISPHGASDVNRMQQVALRAGGRFYEVTDPSKLPQIFIKEASTIQRPCHRRHSAVVMATASAEGIPAVRSPTLRIYTITHRSRSRRCRSARSCRRTQRAGEPVHARCGRWAGLGRSIAFTSDAKKRWASGWVAWENYRKFWSQAVRSVLRTVPRSPYAVQTEIEGGKGKVIVDAIDDQGKFIHTLQFQGSVTTPSGKKLPLGFRQVGPGRYESEFEASGVGIYSVTGTFEGTHGEKGYLSQGVPLSYAAEYRDLKFNPSLLNQLYERTGGRKLGIESDVYAALPRSAGISMPLWPYLLMLVLTLFPIDIFIRRVAVDWGALARKLTPRPRAAKPEEQVPAAIQQLARAKQEVRAEQLTPVDGPVDLGDLTGAPKPASTEAPAGRPAPPPVVAPPPPPQQAEAGGYLNRLLDAKKKSKQKPKE